jgi:SAM-dependent methyltransferase
VVYLFDRGFNCFGIDRDASAVHRIRQLAAERAPHLPPENFRVGDIDRLPWDAASMDAVLSSAVLHFADDLAHFGRMVEEMWRVLAPGGFFFARLASNIGIERIVGADAGRRVRLPDGSERFIVDERMLVEWTERLDAQLLDPIKTTNVQQQRCMTTWCLEKRLA